MSLDLLKFLPAIVSTLSAVRKFVATFSGYAPFASIISPILTGAVDLVAAFVKAFFEGLAITLKNPVVLTVVVTAMAYGYFEGHRGMASEVNVAKKQVSEVQRAKKCVAMPERKTSPIFWEQWGIF